MIGKSEYVSKYVFWEWGVTFIVPINQELSEYDFLLADASSDKKMDDWM